MLVESEIQEGIKVISADGKETGKTTGKFRYCTMEGCTGIRIGVRWSDNKITYPCSAGVKYLEDGSMQII